MGFCTKCGRELADGEVCNCTTENKTSDMKDTAAQAMEKGKETAAQAMEKGKAIAGNIFQFGSELIADPVAVINEYVPSGDVAKAGQLIGCEAVIAALSTFLVYLLRYKYEFGRVISFTLRDAVSTLLVAAVGAYVIMFFADYFDKNKVNFKSGLCIMSLLSIVTIPVEIIYAVFRLINVNILTGLSNCITSGIGMMGYVLLYFGISTVVKEPKKRMYTMGGLYVVVSLVSFVVTKLFA